MAKRRGNVSEDLFAKTEPEKQEDRKTVKQESVETVKATYYLPVTLVDELTFAQARLQRITGRRGHDMSKSIIVATALQLVFEELEEEEEASRLARALSEP